MPPPRDHIDSFGFVALVGFSLLLGFNQVVISVVNGGLQPVFSAGLRSGVAALLIAGWMRYRGIPAAIPRHVVPWALFMGLVFGAEFLCLFIALDLTTVSRTSVIFYTMPIWASLGAHFLIPGDRMTAPKAVGLVLALAGVSWVIANRPSSGEASLAGDVIALAGSFGWAGIALIVRGTPVRSVPLETQLLWQLALSGPLLLVAALFFGPFLRDLAPLHMAGMAFQIVVVASGGYLLWLWLMARYPPSGVVSFSFLSPVFGAGFGWLLLGEDLGAGILGPLALVAAGLYLINRPPRRQVPQKV